MSTATTLSHATPPVANPLYPAFFRLDRLQMLVVGAGEVGEEKLSFILKSSPNARIVVVAPWMGKELRALLDAYHVDYLNELRPNSSAVETVEDAGVDAPDVWIKRYHPERIKLGDTVLTTDNLKAIWRAKEGGFVAHYAREFRAEDVELADLIVAATNFKEINHAVWQAAKTARRLANVADTPSLCDFYLGSIVTRGPLKVAISTNGQSPTFAKRFRQWLEAELPELETTSLLDNLKLFRDRLTGDFQTKVRELNSITSRLLSSTQGSAPLHRCPPGGCLVEAASRGAAAEEPDSAPSN